MLAKAGALNVIVAMFFGGSMIHLFSLWELSTIAIVMISIALGVVGSLVMRLTAGRRNMERVLARRVEFLIAEGRCPACGYATDVAAAVGTHNYWTCPECTAVWRLLDKSRERVGLDSES